MITRSYGLLDVAEDVFHHHVDIGYFGNMGNSERDVAENFDCLYGEGKFAELKPLGTHPISRGVVLDDPSYIYLLRVPREDFRKVTGE